LTPVKRAIALLAALLVGGCTLICFHPREDMDMCLFHWYDASCYGKSNQCYAKCGVGNQPCFDSCMGNCQ
jgi:hypothetical protein